MYSQYQQVQFNNLFVTIKFAEITKFENFDALTVPTNPMLYQEPGISSELFKACGREKLAKACKKIKVKEKQKQLCEQGKAPIAKDPLDFSDFWQNQNNPDNHLKENDEDFKFPATSVIQTKSYGLKEKQNIQSLLLIVEPETFDQQQMIQSIKNILQKAADLKLKKIGLPIICYHSQNFEPKVWAVAYKLSFQQFSQENNYNLQIEIACHTDNIAYSFQRTFRPQEFVLISTQYLTEIKNQEVILNPVNQNDPTFGVSGKILQKAGSLLELDIKSQIKKGKRWIMTDSYGLQENNVKYVLTYIGPIDKKLNRSEKLLYFFDKILNICFVDFKVKSICIPLIAIPQAVFYKQEQIHFVMDRLSISLKEAITSYEDKGKKCGQITISIMDEQMKQFCISLFN